VNSVQYKIYKRRFKKPLTTVRGSWSTRHGVIIRLDADNGMAGFGEAAPLPGFSRETVEEVANAFEAVLEHLVESEIPGRLEDIAALAAEFMPEDIPSGRFALETALCDLAAQLAGKPLARWLSAKAPLVVPVNAMVALPVTDWGAVVKKVRDMDGIRTLKLKISGDMDVDIRQVGEARQWFGPEMNLRLDANRSWSMDQAINFLDRTRGVRFEYIEEPLTDFSIEAFRAIKNVSGAPIALDETLSDHIRPKVAMEKRLCDVIILKPTLLGGIGATAALVGLGREFDIAPVITSTFETEIASAALLHMAAAWCELPAGLDTIHEFKDTELSMFDVSNGNMTVPEKGGLGMRSALWNSP